jgi:hypothetical protein
MRTVRVRLESGVTGAGIEPAARALKERTATVRPGPHGASP